MDDLPKFLTTHECAKWLRTTVGNLAQWRHHKEGPPYVRSGHRVLYRYDEILDWMDGKR